MKNKNTPSDREIEELINYSKKDWSDYNLKDEEESASLNQSSLKNDILSNNSLIDSLKESIKSNVKSFKKNFRENNGNIESKAENKEKPKTEKQKLMEYYQNLKNNSKLNLSNNSNVNVSKETNKFIIDKNANVNYFEKSNEKFSASENSFNYNHQEGEEHLMNSGDNDYVIFDCFKNMLSRNKIKGNSTSKSNTVNSNIHYVSNNYNNFDPNNSNPIPNNNNNQNSSPYIPNIQHIQTQENLETSLIKDLNDFEYEDNLNPNFSPVQIINHNSESKSLSVQLLPSNEKKCDPHCAFYKKKYVAFKQSSREYKRKYLREKKISEMLKLRLLFENAKLSNMVTSEKLNSTNVSKNNEEESRLTKLLYDKLQDNNVLFEKLENEILNKDLIIKKQNESITHQKQTIDGLLEQFNIFLNQGNYMINDILLLKQSMYDKNFTEVSREFNSLNLTINEYTNKIKDFSERTKGIINGEVKDVNTLPNSPNKLNTIEEINSDQNESVLSFSLTKSNINTTQNEDRSLKLFELSSKETDDFFNC